MNITLLGDIAFTGILSTESRKNHQRFEHIGPILHKSEMVFANLEVPLKVDESRNEYKSFIHYSLPKPTKNLLELLNIGCVSLANNHIYDCKMPGLKATIDLLDEIGIHHTGAGWLQAHVQPAIINKGEKKIAFLAYVDQNTNPKTEAFPELLINYFNPENVVRDIQNIKDKVDNVIVSIHWGVDYSSFYTNDQQQFARKILQAGADIIMGHHSHTLQSFEIIDNKLVFYSLGQLCFGDIEWDNELRALKKKTKSGMIVEITLTNDCCDYKLIPTIEKPQNYISISSVDINKKLNKLGLINEKISRHKSLAFVAHLKETIFDRLHEFFFGYYRNAFRQLIDIKNFKKISYLIRDFKKFKSS